MTQIRRRVLADDNRGVAEALNETGVDGRGLRIIGTHRLILDTPANSPKLHKTCMQRHTFPPVLSFTPLRHDDEAWSKAYNSAYAGLKSPLPDAIHLLSVHDNSYYGKIDTMVILYYQFPLYTVFSCVILIICPALLFFAPSYSIT